MKEFAIGLGVELRIVHALILRETRTRFGRNQLGYLWAFAEPLIWIGTFAGMFYFLGRLTPAGMDSIGFLATGIVTFSIFRTCVDRSMTAIDGNKALLFYPQVRPLDLIAARATLELVTLATVLAIVLCINSVFLGRFEIDNLLLMMGGVLFAGLLGSALGLVAASGAVFSPLVERSTGPLMRPLFWISGLFFCADDIPASAREIMLYNPIFHVIEMVRDGWYLSYTARYINILYPAGWLLGLAFIGLPLERAARRRLELT